MKKMIVIILLIENINDEIFKNKQFMNYRRMLLKLKEKIYDKDF